MGVADLPRPVGYVLGGGGSLGAVQVGMLRFIYVRDHPSCHRWTVSRRSSGGR